MNNYIKTRSLFIGIVLLGFSSIAYVNNYFEVSKNIEIFTSLYKQLNTFYVDETKPGELMKTGINSMLKSLDPYTVYFPESKIEDYRYLSTGKYGGIGITSHFNKEKQLVVSEVYEGFPGDKAGLQPGDIITLIDGAIFEDKDANEIGELIKGQAGSSLQLKVNRPLINETLDIDVTREDVAIPSVPYYGMIDEKLGYIKLKKFTKTASKDIRNAIKDLKTQGMTELVLDLRYNGGGLLREAINIVNFFVPKDVVVVKTKGKIDSWNKTYKSLQEPLVPDMPLTVLVNGRSASASEIVSGTLQDLDRAVVLGTQSFGKGLVQQTKDIAYNSKLKLTVAKYYTPSGRCIQKLDYSNKKEGVAEAIDDKDISEFRTNNGRPVFDGKGITPDITIETVIDNKILNGLETDHVIFNYATQYYYQNDSIVDAADFRISNADYDNFVDFAINSNFEYNTKTEDLLTKLIEASVEENYFEAAENEITKLKNKITPNKKDDLNKYKKQIKKLIEGEITSRYYYQNGRVKNELAIDTYIEHVKTVFATNYDQILSGTGK